MTPARKLKLDETDSTVLDVSSTEGRAQPAMERRSSPRR